jgi:hypothetical protein
VRELQEKHEMTSGARYVAPPCNLLQKIK